MPRRATILAVNFLFGAYAVWAQATLLREAQVVLFGSELSWGLVLAFWLSGVAMGASVGRHMEQGRRPWMALVLSGLAMPAALAAEVALVRHARLALGAAAGEYLGFGQMVALAAAATIPVSVWVGLAFPAASVLLVRAEAKKTPGIVSPKGPEGAAPKRHLVSFSPWGSRARAVGWVYLCESAGSLVGGAVFSFVLVTWTSAPVVALGGGVLLAAGAARIAWEAGGRRAWLVAPAAYLALAAAGPWINRATIRARWETFAPGQRLEESLDTRYQNVAIGRLQDQVSLYTNGTVAAVWPNHYDLAIEAHLAACECPSPRRVLLLGGGIHGLVKELLRHRPDRLDYVTLDRAEFQAVREYLAPADRAAADAIRPTTHFADARRFIKQAHARTGQRWDLVLLAAPEPASVLEARLYTEEFFAEVASVLSEGGVLAFALSGSIGHWGPEAAHYVGSIVRPLRRVFPEVLLTFGHPTWCFAALGEGALAETGEDLARRWRSRGVESPYFDASWFEGASDLLDAAKRADQEARLAAARPRFDNADDQPAAAVYRLLLWYQTAGAAHRQRAAPSRKGPGLLAALLDLRFEWAVWAVAGGTVAAGLFGAAGRRRGLARAALLWSVGTTGFASMAVEIVLLYTFQTLYGYVYGMVGLVIGTFMAGLVLGSVAANRHLARTGAKKTPGVVSAERPSGPSGKRHPVSFSAPGLRTILALDLAGAVFAAALVLALAALRTSAADWPVQAATFGLVVVSGVLGGLVFPLAAGVAVGDRTPTGRAAGAIDAADHAGACLGALVTGVALVPVLGASGTCLVVAALKTMSALLVGTAALAPPLQRRGRDSP